MRRLPLLFISILLLAVAAGIIYFWISFSAAPIQQQHVFTQQMSQTAFPVIPLAFFAVVVGGFLIWIWALVHMLTNQALQGTDKIVWTIVIVFLNILGAILYFLVAPVVKIGTPKPQI